MLLDNALKFDFAIKISVIILTSIHGIRCSKANGRFTQHLAALFTLLVIRPVTVCILGVINRCTVIDSCYSEVM